MTRKDFHTAFNIQLDKSDSISHPSFLSVEKDYWINQAIKRIIKTRISGNNPRRKGFQQDAKRNADLRTVVATQSYFEDQMYHEVDNVNHLTNYTLDYPTSYWLTLGETAYITSDEATWPKQNDLPIIKMVDVLECTIDNITTNINNRLSEHRMRNNYARPLRLEVDNSVLLYTDDKYTIAQYDLTYIKRPEVFTRTTENENQEYTGMPEHIHDEIVACAVRLALASITDERYSLYATEDQTIE